MKRAAFLILIALSGIMPLSSSGSGYPGMYEAGNDTLGPKYGNDSASCVMNISLYREFFKQWKAGNYQNPAIHDAIRPWRWVLLNCPRGTENTYIDGVKIMEFMINSEKDPAARKLLIDTLMLVYDQRIKYFGKEGYVLGRKGADLYQYRPDAYEESFNTLKKSVALEGNASASAILVFYFRTSIDMVTNNKDGKELIVETYDIISDILDYNLANNTKQAEQYENARTNIEAAFIPFASCTDLVDIYRKKYSETPENPELLKKIIKILDKKGCTDDPLYFEATVSLYKLEPSPLSALLIGKMYFKKEEYSKAIGYLREADKLDDKGQQFDGYLLTASAYFSLRQYPNARSAALKAAEVRPGDGRPYILIGDLYTSSASDCGEDKVARKAAFWAAVDKYIKAKNVDPSVENEANAKIATYSRYFPPHEDVFFFDLKEGQSYTVGCWINEVTTVRSLP
jgi:tetratricopeptide (TPR) repeat protein